MQSKIVYHSCLALHCIPTYTITDTNVQVKLPQIASFFTHKHIWYEQIYFIATFLQKFTII